MALFEPRKAEKAEQDGGKRARPTRRAVDSVDDMRRRARHRLIGACLLVLAAIVVFPMLFDTEPRPLPVNAQVSVAGRDTSPPLNAPAQVAMNSHGLSDGEEVVDTPAVTTPQTTPAATQSRTTAVPAATATANREPSAAARPTQEVASLASQRAQEARTQAQRAQTEEAKPTAKPANSTTTNAATTNNTATAQVKPAVKTAETKPVETKPVATTSTVAAATTPAAVVPPPPPAKPVPARSASSDEAARAKALLEGRPVEATTAANRSDEGRFIVQIGAFSDEAKVREIRQKLEGAGLKTYTQVIQTGSGRATRVRVGPFANRAEADRAAERVKAVSLPAAIMSM
ncbi:SPOR domain-containing protein [Lampropedia puyangensis]|uniref:SPOR domain-containing protein n=1 Tax=Lampropedia puyangensis TaxID=1330072 RepID=A0A4S8FAI5_9BURK|nr:SPOR domain-containing protein [Lampropedia puyangensis]THU04031.1 SPOR domain-containing protein [Lampropedia puyangensis]